MRNKTKKKCIKYAVVMVLLLVATVCFNTREKKVFAAGVDDYTYVISGNETDYEEGEITVKKDGVVIGTYVGNYSATSEWEFRTSGLTKAIAAIIVDANGTQADIYFDNVKTIGTLDINKTCDLIFYGDLVVRCIFCYADNMSIETHFNLETESNAFYVDTNENVRIKWVEGSYSGYELLGLNGSKSTDLEVNGGTFDCQFIKYGGCDDFNCFIENATITTTKSAFSGECESLTIKNSSITSEKYISDNTCGVIKLIGDVTLDASTAVFRVYDDKAFILCDVTELNSLTGNLTYYFGESFFLYRQFDKEMTWIKCNNTNIEQIFDKVSVAFSEEPTNVYVPYIKNDNEINFYDESRIVSPLGEGLLSKAAIYENGKFINLDYVMDGDNKSKTYSEDNMEVLLDDLNDALKTSDFTITLGSGFVTTFKFDGLIKVREGETLKLDGQAEGTLLIRGSGNVNSKLFLVGNMSVSGLNDFVMESGWMYSESQDRLLEVSANNTVIKRAARLESKSTAWAALMVFSGDLDFEGIASASYTGVDYRGNGTAIINGEVQSDSTKPAVQCLSGKIIVGDDANLTSNGRSIDFYSINCPIITEKKDLKIGIYKSAIDLTKRENFTNMTITYIDGFSGMGAADNKILLDPQITMDKMKELVIEGGSKTSYLPVVKNETDDAGNMTKSIYVISKSYSSTISYYKDYESYKKGQALYSENIPLGGDSSIYRYDDSDEWYYITKNKVDKSVAVNSWSEACIPTDGLGCTVDIVSVGTEIAKLNVNGYGTLHYAFVYKKDASKVESIESLQTVPKLSETSLYGEKTLTYYDLYSGTEYYFAYYVSVGDLKSELKTLELVTDLQSDDWFFDYENETIMSNAETIQIKQGDSEWENFVFDGNVSKYNINKIISDVDTTVKLRCKFGDCTTKEIEATIPARITPSCDSVVVTSDKLTISDSNTRISTRISWIQDKTYVYTNWANKTVYTDLRPNTEYRIEIMYLPDPHGSFRSNIQTIYRSTNKGNISIGGITYEFPDNLVYDGQEKEITVHSGSEYAGKMEFYTIPINEAEFDNMYYDYQKLSKEITLETDDDEVSDEDALILHDFITKYAKNSDFFFGRDKEDELDEDELDEFVAKNVGCYAVLASIEPSEFSHGILLLMCDKPLIITPKPIVEDMVDSIDAQTYTGMEIEPEISFTEELVEDVDYTVKYSNNSNAGDNTATIEIQGINNYSGSVVRTFSIVKTLWPSVVPENKQTVAYLTEDASSIELPENWQWISDDLELEVGVTKSITANYIGEDADLYANTSIDIEVTRSSCTHPESVCKIVNKQNATFEQAGYSGDCVCEDCGEKLLQGNEVASIGRIQLDSNQVVYKGNEICPGVTVWDTNEDIIDSEEYSVKYSNNNSVGKGTVEVTFNDENYSGSKTVYFDIVFSQPKISKVSLGSKGITVIWNGVDGAKEYNLLRKANGEAYKKIATVNADSKLSYIDDMLENGSQYTYTVQAVLDTVVSTYDNAGKSYVYLKQSSPTLENEAAGVKVSWSKNTKSGGYKLYKSTDGKKYTCIKTITKNTSVSFVDANARTSGAKYYYKITAIKTVNGVTYESLLSGASFIYRYARPTIGKLVADRKAISVVCKGNTKATGYEIQYSQKANFASGNKTVKAKGIGSITKKISSLTSGKKYYVRIRVYKTVSKKTYVSAWSAVKYITTKK